MQFPQILTHFDYCALICVSQLFSILNNMPFQSDYLSMMKRRQLVQFFIQNIYICLMHIAQTILLCYCIDVKSFSRISKRCVFDFSVKQCYCEDCLLVNNVYVCLFTCTKGYDISALQFRYSTAYEDALEISSVKETALILAHASRCLVFLSILLETSIFLIPVCIPFAFAML